MGIAFTIVVVMGEVIGRRKAPLRSAECSRGVELGPGCLVLDLR